MVSIPVMVFSAYSSDQKGDDLQQVIKPKVLELQDRLGGVVDKGSAINDGFDKAFDEK